MRENFGIINALYIFGVGVHDEHEVFILVSTKDDVRDFEAPVQALFVAELTHLASDLREGVLQAASIFLN